MTPPRPALQPPPDPPGQLPGPSLGHAALVCGRRPRVLGIDPGSRNLGWGIVERQGSRLVHIASGTLHARQDNFVARMCQLIEALERCCQQHGPTSCAIETAFAGKNVHSALVLGQARGAVLVALGRMQLSIAEYTPMQIKQAATGRGQADKQQVAGMVALLLGLQGETLELDTTDALACALCHAQRSDWPTVTPAPRQTPLARRRPARAKL